MADLIFPLQLKRQFVGPLDPDMVFATLAAMEAYRLTSGVKYPGQIVSCIEDEGTYKLKSDMSAWVEVGKEVEVDQAPFDGNGAISGMNLSINTNPAQFNIAAGTYHKIGETGSTYFAGVSGIDASYLTQYDLSYVALDLNTMGVMQNPVQFTATQRRSYLLLGALQHPNRTSITGANTFPDVAVHGLAQTNDLLDALRQFNVVGNKFIPDGPNLSLSKTEGSMCKRAIGYTETDGVSKPHTKVLDSLISPLIVHKMSNGTETAPTVSVEKYYEAVGIRTAIPVAKFTIHRVYIMASNVVRIQIGQNLYNSMSEALSGISSEAYTNENTLAQNGLLRAYLVIKGSATNLNTATEAKFVEADKFGLLPLGASGEIGLGNPTTLDEVLTSTLDGVRSWSSLLASKWRFGVVGIYSTTDLPAQMNRSTWTNYDVKFTYRDGSVYNYLYKGAGIADYTALLANEGSSACGFSLVNPNGESYIQFLFSRFATGGANVATPGLTVNALGTELPTGQTYKVNSVDIASKWTVNGATIQRAGIVKIGDGTPLALNTGYDHFQMSDRSDIFTSKTTGGLWITENMHYRQTPGWFLKDTTRAGSHINLVDGNISFITCAAGATERTRVYNMEFPLAGGYSVLEQASAPSNIATRHAVYALTGDSMLKSKDDSGNEYLLSMWKEHTTTNYWSNSYKNTASLLAGKVGKQFYLLQNGYLTGADNLLAQNTGSYFSQLSMINGRVSLGTSESAQTANSAIIGALERLSIERNGVIKIGAQATQDYSYLNYEQLQLGSKSTIMAGKSGGGTWITENLFYQASPAWRLMDTALAGSYISQAEGNFYFGVTAPGVGNRTIVNNIEFPAAGGVSFLELAAAPTAGAGRHIAYATNESMLKSKDDTGTEYLLSMWATCPSVNWNCNSFKDTISLYANKTSSDSGLLFNAYIGAGDGVFAMKTGGYFCQISTGDGAIGFSSSQDSQTAGSTITNIVGNMTIERNGVIRVGPSATALYQAVDYTHIQVGARGSLMAGKTTAEGMWVCQNMYFHSSGAWRQRDTSISGSTFLQYGGGFVFNTAPAGAGDSIVTAVVTIPLTGGLILQNATTLPGAVANSASIYASAGEMYVVDSSGNRSQISPHDEDSNWIFNSRNDSTGKKIKIRVEEMLKFLEAKYGTNFIEEVYDA